MRFFLKRLFHISRRLLAFFIEKLQECFYKKSVDLHLHTTHYSPSGYNDENIVNMLRDLNGFTFIPNYGNMGDIVIAQAEYQLFEKYRFLYDVFHGKVTRENLVYGGGGRFVKNWSHRYASTLPIFQQPHIKRIVILPSSFHDCSDLLKVIDKRFVIFCREKQSYDYLLASNTNARIYLEHDMVFFMTDDFMKTTNVRRFNFTKAYRKVSWLVPDLMERNGIKIAWFLRTDSESKTDWTRFDDIKPTLDLSICAHSDSRDGNVCNFYTKLFFSAIDTADMIVTDRLHVGICSMLMGKEVFLVDNSYGKVSGVYEHSMKQNSRVHFIDDVKRLSGILEQAISERIVRQTASLSNLMEISKVLS